MENTAEKQNHLIKGWKILNLFGLTVAYLQRCVNNILKFLSKIYFSSSIHIILSLNDL